MNGIYTKSIDAGMPILMITVFFTPEREGAFLPGDEMRGWAGGKKGYHRAPLGIWRNPQLVQELGLTDEQVKQVRAAEFTFREKHLALRARLDGCRLQLDEAFSADIVDNTTVLDLAVKIADIKAELFVQDITSHLALGKILNRDQIRKLKNHDMRRQRNNWNHGKKQMPAIPYTHKPGD